MIRVVGIPLDGIRGRGGYKGFRVLRRYGGYKRLRVFRGSRGGVFMGVVLLFHRARFKPYWGRTPIIRKTLTSIP